MPAVDPNAVDPNTSDNPLTAGELLNASIWRGDQVTAVVLVKRAEEKLADDPEAVGWKYILDRWNASSLSRGRGQS